WSVCLSSRARCLLFFFFFFQAEDGIRDWSVTGVQTCALPISSSRDQQGPVGGERDREDSFRLAGQPLHHAAAAGIVEKDLAVARSEERRVGKECRSRWAPRH